jgi:hypothetical protein
MKRPSARCTAKDKKRIVQLSKSRHRVLPCCERRTEWCVCNDTKYTEVIKKVDVHALQEFKDQIKNGQLFSVLDTEDTSFFLDKHGDLSMLQILVLALWFRHFGNVLLWNEFLAEGCLGVHENKEPDWAGVEKVLHAAWTNNLRSKGGSVYGPFYRPRTMRAHRNPAMDMDHCEGTQTKWQTVKLSDVHGEDVATRTGRDMMAMVSLYNAGVHCAFACQSYTEEPSQDAYAHLYDLIDTEVSARTDGIFGDYALKLVLDILICADCISSTHVSKWPTNCDGYPDAMKEVFPGLHKRHWLAGFHYLYREVGGSCHLKFPEVIMHLCWKKRRESGVLREVTSKPGKAMKKQA